MGRPVMNDNKYRGVTSVQPAAPRFTTLETYKDQWLTTVRECSGLTKSLVVPPSGHNPGQPVVVPNQSHGGRLVSNLVSQLLLILFPPSISFYKLDLRDIDIKEMAKGIQLPEGKSMHDGMRETFVSLENNSAVAFDSLGIRERVRMVLYHLVVAGTSMYLTPDEETMELIPMNDWVCVRDTNGDLIEVIYRQTYPVDSLPEGANVSQQIQDQGFGLVYTRAFKKDNWWHVTKYCEHSPEPFETLKVKPDDFWVHVPYWELAQGEDYGRGPVEESLGDLRTFESGTQIINQSATALAKVIFTVSPNGMTKAQDVADAENTEIISGDAQDVGVIQANKVYDMSGFIGFIDGIRRDLDVAFMMPGVIRREAERVTAEEIRRMAAEFEKSRGGTYNSLAKHLQTPLANMLLRWVLKNSSTFQGLKPSDLLPVVNTGLQGLGRSLELENLLMFLESLRMLPGLEQRIKHGPLISKMASLRGLEINDMIKSEEELQMEAQVAAIESMAQQVGPDIITQQGVPQ